MIRIVVVLLIGDTTLLIVIHVVSSTVPVLSVSLLQLRKCLKALPFAYHSNDVIGAPTLLIRVTLYYINLSP